MGITVTTDADGNRIIKVFQGKALISEQVTTVKPTSNVPISEQDEKIVSVENSVFCLRNYKDDFIQSSILRSNEYFGAGELKVMSSYLNENSVVLDIGANIGNHTLYFANECNVKKIYAFEPVPYTYNLLKQNIKLNKLEDRVETYCCGVSDKITNGTINTYDLKNLGGTRLKQCDEGDIKLVTLDSLNIKEKIDFIKIDVETMDYEVLNGAKKTIKKSMPVIEIESFDQELKKTDALLKLLGYKVAHEFKSCCEYIYVPDD